MINLIYKHFIWLYFFLFLGCVITYANEFPTDADLKMNHKPLSFPSKKSLEETYKTSSEQWDKFKSLQLKASQFPVIGNLASPSKSFDEIIKYSQVTPVNSTDPNLLVFASFSMPESRLKALVKDTARVGGVVLLRGLLMDNNGQPSFKLTAVKLKSLKLDKGEGIQIAPNLFEQYAVSRIPAFLVFNDGACLKCSNETPKTHQKVYGDVSVRYALKDIESRDSSLINIVETMIKRLDVSFYRVDQ